MMDSDYLAPLLLFQFKTIDFIFGKVYREFYILEELIDYVDFSFLPQV